MTCSGAPCEAPDAGLAREGGTCHFDQAPVHLVTDAALSWLAARVTDASVDARRLRPDLAIRTSLAAGLPADGWIGRTAQVGGGVGPEHHPPDRALRHGQQRPR